MNARGAGGLDVLMDELDQLAGEVDRLILSHRDPERFFMNRSEIVSRLRRASAAVRDGDCAHLLEAREAREAKTCRKPLPP